MTKKASKPKRGHTKFPPRRNRPYQRSKLRKPRVDVMNFENRRPIAEEVAREEAAPPVPKSSYEEFNELIGVASLQKNTVNPADRALDRAILNVDLGPLRGDYEEIVVPHTKIRWPIFDNVMEVVVDDHLALRLTVPKDFDPLRPVVLMLHIPVKSS